jgi:hypothetical protein
MPKKKKLAVRVEKRKKRRKKLINVLRALPQSIDWTVYMHHGCVHGGETAARQCDTRVSAEL